MCFGLTLTISPNFHQPFPPRCCLPPLSLSFFLFTAIDHACRKSARPALARIGWLLRALSYILLPRHGPPGHSRTLPLICLLLLTPDTDAPPPPPLHTHIHSVLEPGHSHNFNSSLLTQCSSWLKRDKDYLCYLYVCTQQHFYFTFRLLNSSRRCVLPKRALHIVLIAEKKV